MLAVEMWPWQLGNPLLQLQVLVALSTFKVGLGTPEEKLNWLVAQAHRVWLSRLLHSAHPTMNMPMGVAVRVCEQGHLPH
jgi:hypothetical protein